MNGVDDWTPEEKERVIAVFDWLLKQDMKQNPEKYTKSGELPSKSEVVE